MKNNSSKYGLISAVFAFFIVTLDVSAVNIALPAIQREFSRSSLIGLQWVTDSYTLMFAALTLTAGVFSDRIGAHRAYGWGLIIFTGASLICGLAPSLDVLIAARIVQGCAAAVMIPSSLALIRQSSSELHVRSRGIAMWTSGAAIAMALGPVFGGFLTEYSWRIVFWINVPIGIICFIILLRVKRSAGSVVTFDFPGQIAVILFLFSLTFALIEEGHKGIDSLVLITTLIAIVSGACFLIFEKNKRTPMLSLAVFSQREILISAVSGFACNVAFYGGVFVLSLFFQEQIGQSTLTAGLMFVPMALITAITNYFSPRAVKLYGTRGISVTGFLIGTFGCLALSVIDTKTPWALITIIMIPLGIGGSLAMTALTSLSLESVSHEKAGTTAALINTSRQVGGAISIAIFGGLIDKNFIAGMQSSFVISALLLFIVAISNAVLLPKKNKEDHIL